MLALPVLAAVVCGHSSTVAKHRGPFCPSAMAPRIAISFSGGRWGWGLAEQLTALAGVERTGLLYGHQHIALVEL